MLASLLFKSEVVHLAIQRLECSPDEDSVLQLEEAFAHVTLSYTLHPVQVEACISIVLVEMAPRLRVVASRAHGTPIHPKSCQTFLKPKP